MKYIVEIIVFLAILTESHHIFNFNNVEEAIEFQK